MTTKDERYNAIIRTREFLRDLLDPKKTPKVPKDIRRQAYSALRHYPHEYEMQMAHRDYEAVFGIPPKKRSK